MSHTRRTFARIYGTAPELAWWAPGRVNLIGEHTDHNDGFVLPFALPLGVTAAVRARSDGVLRIASAQLDGPGGSVSVPVDELRPGRVTGWAAYVAGAVWALAEALREPGVRVPGADLLVSATVPSGAGLSSSAALECSTVGAISALAGVELPPVEVARIAQRAENDFVGVPCGIMDQMASMLGQDGHALFLDTRSLHTEQVPLDLRTAGMRILVIDTQAHHTLADGEYAVRRRQCQQAADLLGVPALRDVTDPDRLDALTDPVLRRRARHIVTENARVLETVEHLRQQQIAQIGPLLTAGHASLRDDFEVSCDELDLAVQVSLDAGAFGARMIGAGFGGSAIALVAADTLDSVDAAVRAEFERRSYAAPRLIPAWPSAGAGPEEDDS